MSKLTFHCKRVDFLSQKFLINLNLVGTDIFSTADLLVIHTAQELAGRLGPEGVPLGVVHRHGRGR